MTPIGVMGKTRALRQQGNVPFFFVPKRTERMNGIQGGAMSFTLFI